MPIIAKDILHKSSDIAWHASLLTEFLGGDLSELLPMDVETLFSSVHVAQALAIAKDDLACAGKSEHALAVKLRKRS
jgi:hypothetical protein